MSTSLNWALERAQADFAALSYPPFSLGQDDTGAPVVLWTPPEASLRFLVSQERNVEESAAYMAWQLQDYVVMDQHGAWPEVDGRPLFPSSGSGVACWCLGGKPWCAIGQLQQAITAHHTRESA